MKSQRRRFDSGTRDKLGEQVTHELEKHKNTDGSISGIVIDRNRSIHFQPYT